VRFPFQPQLTQVLRRFIRNQKLFISLLGLILVLMLTLRGYGNGTKKIDGAFYRAAVASFTIEQNVVADVLEDQEGDCSSFVQPLPGLNAAANFNSIGLAAMQVNFLTDLPPLKKSIILISCLRI
jgi:hypothetical protein